MIAPITRKHTHWVALRISLLSFLFLLYSNSSFAQSAQGAAIHGHILNASTHEPIIGARIEVTGTTKGAVSNKQGEYRITELPPASFHLRARSLGFEDKEQDVTLDSTDLELDITMHETSVKGQEVVVQDDLEREQEQKKVSQITLSQSVINAVPAVGGESDIFRVLQMLPGVKSLSEISSGLYIRGGAPDENLIMLDGNVIYNPSHMFGFFSTFNTDAVKDVELSKGGFGAQYGGRLTGVLNVTSRDGDRNGIHGKTSISLISAKQTIEAPLGNGSILLSGRRTYIDAFLDLINGDKLLNGGDPLPKYYFYDLNAKVTQDLSQSDNLSLSGYYGADHLKYPVSGLVDINLTWGNKMGEARWTHLFSPQAFSTVFAGYTQYTSSSFGNFTNNSFQFENGIKEYTLHSDFDVKLGAHDLRAGAAGSHFDFKFFNAIGATNKPLKDTSGNPLYFSLYGQDEWKITDKLSTSYGVRYEYMDLAEKATFDPRFTMSYAVSPLWTVKGSAGIYHQYFHLVSIGQLSFFDLWVPGTKPLPPSESQQYILGLSGYPSEEYYTSVEVYYKPLKDIVTYNQTKFLSNDISELFPRGTGKAYGAEFYLERRIGDLTGWIGYTLAWVKDKFDILDSGREFSPKYDQRHDVQVVLNYKISDRWQAGLAFTYATGQAYTSAQGFYRLSLDEVAFQRDILIPGHIGDSRLPAYHRADANLTYKFKLWGKDASASLQVFNMYSHRNVWFRVVDTKETPAQISDILLLPIVPTIGMEVSY